MNQLYIVLSILLGTMARATDLPSASSKCSAIIQEGLTRVRLQRMPLIYPSLQMSVPFRKFLSARVGATQADTILAEPNLRDSEANALNLHVEAYADYLSEQNVWDAAIPLDANQDFVGFNIKAFNPAVIYAGDQVYQNLRRLGVGSEHTVIKVKNIATAEERVMKLGIPYSTIGSAITAQRLIKSAGVPVVDMQPLGLHANFVEELSQFGSDLVQRSISTGDSKDLDSLISFYKTLLETSPLRIGDIKPANIGRRANGEWVLTDWILLAEENKVPAKISKTELGESIAFSFMNQVKLLSGGANSERKREIDANALTAFKKIQTELGLQDSLLRWFPKN